jgi:4-oxalomesaconate tautomerase
MKQLAIPCLFFRCGTSRGPFFLKADLPTDEVTRDNVLLAVMGSPDERQIDGIGGATTLTSKVGILSPSNHPWADVDFLFGQVSITNSKVDWEPSCGNMVAGVGPAAIEIGLVKAGDITTTVKIRNLNTNSLIESIVRTEEGKVKYDGDTSIDGVPGTAAPVLLNFMEVVGSKTGKLLPTGHRCEEIEGVEVTCIDVAMPMVIARANTLGKTGYETKAELDADKTFLERIEKIRRIAGERMGLRDVADSVIPKFAIIAPPRYGGNVTSRYFVPHACHTAHAVTGAICIGCCSLLKGTVADSIATVTGSGQETIVIEHPSGKIDIFLVTRTDGSEMFVESAGVVRTVRLLLSGYAHVSNRLWN